VEGMGTLTVTPQAHSFGPIAIGATSDSFSFLVSNAGSGPVRSFVVNLNGPDFIAPMVDDKCALVTTLAAGASCAVGVRFKPVSRGIKSGSLVASGDGQTVTATLTGTGQSVAQLLISPMAQMFAGQIGKEGQPIHFTIANAGDVATGALTVAIGGTDAVAFKIVSNSCLAPLAFGASCTVGVSMNASSAGTKVAVLTVSSSVGGMATASLTGQAN
jgi:hypothetical protein